MDSNMKFYIIVLYYCILVVKHNVAGPCGCRDVRQWYKQAIEHYHAKDEAGCIEEAAIGTGTMLVYMKMLDKYCNHVKVITDSYTYGEKALYEVEIHFNIKTEDVKSTPVIIIDAGQDAGSEPSQFALFIIEQLLTCQENEDMIKNVKWVILPCTNPDGMEYSRVNKFWKKNYRPLDDDMSTGVDISKNFDNHWSSCTKVNSGFSHDFPGTQANSENETMFVTNVLNKYKDHAKIYVSLRRDGHYIGYPYAYSEQDKSTVKGLTKVAAEVAAKVNQRAGAVQVFLNDSIYSLQGKPNCGHSVDLAIDMGIPLTYEMRVFPAKENDIMGYFHSLPRGYDTTLKGGYFNGIRELYNAIVNKKKYPDLFEAGSPVKAPLKVK